MYQSAHSVVICNGKAGKSNAPTTWKDVVCILRFRVSMLADKRIPKGPQTCNEIRCDVAKKGRQKKLRIFEERRST